MPRLDQACQSYFPTRTKAQDAIKAGRVMVNEIGRAHV
nr:S4 domain-containing protein [uncultured Dubosiella sp.]